jgi:hypothetical protein
MSAWGQNFPLRFRLLPEVKLTLFNPATGQECQRQPTQALREVAKIEDSWAI